MLKIIGLKFIVLVLVVFSVADSSLAQTRIKFARGKSSATVRGTLAADETREFALKVRFGQTLSVRMTPAGNNIDAEVSNYNGHVFWVENGSGKVVIDENGDYYIVIKNSGRAATRYSLTVTVR
jgi:hypothetical protein